MSQEKPVTSPKADGGAKPAACVTEPCPLAKCDPAVTIGRVMRGNPYVASNAPAADGMPDSVPPSKTYEVEVTVTPSMEACPSQFIELKVVGTNGDSGSATVTPARITATTKVVITGVNQSKEGHGGQLKIQAKLDGTTLKAESAPFTVCAHPVNFRDAYKSDIDEPDRVGFVVDDSWDSDSGTLAHLDKAEISEVVEYDAPVSPPYAGAGRRNNSGYLVANSFTTDTHTIGRPTAGPAATWERRQVSIFKCLRCGATDKPQPRSGLKIVHSVYQAGRKWKHTITKTGAKVTANGYTSEAATANATSPVHDLD